MTNHTNCDHFTFSIVCKMSVKNSCGCAVVSPIKLPHNKQYTYIDENWFCSVKTDGSQNHLNLTDLDRTIAVPHLGDARCRHSRHTLKVQYQSRIIGMIANNTHIDCRVGSRPDREGIYNTQRGDDTRKKQKNVGRVE